MELLIYIFLICIICAVCYGTVSIMIELHEHILIFYIIYILLSLIILHLTPEEGDFLRGLNVALLGAYLFFNLICSSVVYYISRSKNHNNGNKYDTNFLIDDNNILENQCPNCNKEWDNTYEFCPLCGKKLE